MEQHKDEAPTRESAESAPGSSGQTHTGQHPALEPQCDDRARQGESGEGDRTDTDEMHDVNNPFKT